MMETMPPEYFETHFRCDDPAADWPAEFVIITAYATTGEEWPEARNIEADRQLETELRRRGVWLKRATGYSPTTGHAEPGWAAGIGISEGRELGKWFLQHAVYHVQLDCLSVVSCDESQNSAVVGSFRERILSI